MIRPSFFSPTGIPACLAAVTIGTAM